MSKILLSRYLVTSIFNITWCTHSNRVLACVFLIVINTGLISKSFSKGVKYCLNSDPCQTLLCMDACICIAMCCLKTG